jgi:hypothetical protein
LSFEDGGASVGGNNTGSAGGRGRFTANMAMGELGLGTLATDNKGTTFPDVVGALRIDQAWGYAQVAAALHDASGGYYGGANSDLNGHPSDKLGFAATAGFTLNDILGFKGLFARRRGLRHPRDHALPGLRQQQQRRFRLGDRRRL